MEKKNLKILTKENLKELIPIYGFYETIKRQVKKEPSLVYNWGTFLGAYQGVSSSATIINGLEQLLQFL